mmetsp:Transcript_32101/g.48818  ORF Transcript_32101/g.48818 Transcript_32101/m.48818 type:complete len:936 (-) Transcript_32101:1663-4470(-)
MKEIATPTALVILLISCTQAFTPVSQRSAFLQRTCIPSWKPPSSRYRNSLILHAKKKKQKIAVSFDVDDFDDDEPMSLKDQKDAAKKQKKKDTKSAALEALDAIDDDEPLSLKDQKEAEKMEKKAEKKIAQQALKMEQEQPQEVAQPKMSAQDPENMFLESVLEGMQKEKDEGRKKSLERKADKAASAELEVTAAEEKKIEEEKKAAQEALQPELSSKEKALIRALEMEAADEARAAAADTASDEPKLSKKELKALKKKEEKEAAKAAKRAEKKEAKALEVEATQDSENILEGESKPEQNSKTLTLEEKIRKDRPPPRIRVMESAQPGYISLRLEGVSITFRDQEVLRDVTWGVQTGDRIGLVGANGAGKTTQLRILAGELEPTTGDVVKSSKDLRVAMLRQEFVDELVKTRTLKEEFMSVFEEENEILQRIRDSEKELESIGEEESDRMQEVLDRMQDLQNTAENKEVYALESRCKKVMDLMGFTEDEGEDLVASFSGGWKMRIGLGKVLLKEPNVLLLDEPTNHLDLESVEWLEEFLRQQSIPMILVSHDREFLDQVCTKTVDAEGGICTEYDGNYSRFLAMKKARMDSWHAAYNAQEKKLKEEKKWINKFKIKQPQAVKQRQAKLEKFVKSDEYVKKPPFVGKPFRFRFPDAPRLSPEVAEIKELSHSYRNGETENKLFDKVDLFIEKGDRMAVVGPNGSGKSTLLRLLLNREKSDEGTAEIVGQNVDVNYFEQNQADALDLDMTVIETVQSASVDQSYNEMRALLGQFLFKGDAVEKKVRFLSGGEKARLSLACMMLTPANLLVLDEPTNHLDIPAKEMLEEALQHFTGSVMVISHDRYFISRVATSIVAIEDKKLEKYNGDYKFFMDHSKKMKERIEARYIKGVSRIENAPVIDLEELNKPKGNFGGAKTANMVTRKNKGVKNAKRNQLQ